MDTGTKLHVDIVLIDVSPEAEARIRTLAQLAGITYDQQTARIFACGLDEEERRLLPRVEVKIGGSDEPASSDAEDETPEPPTTREGS